MIAVRSGVECRLFSEGGEAADPMAEIPSFLGCCQVGEQVHLFVSYSAFTEDYCLNGAELAPCPQQLPAPVLLAHGSSQGAWVLTPRSILLLSPARGELPLPFAAELAAADAQYVVCASRGDVAVLAVEEGAAKVLCRYTTEYDVGCVEVKASAEGCVILLGEWVTNCLHVLTVAAGRVAHVVKREMQSAIVSLLVTDVPADSHNDSRAEIRAETCADMRFVVVSESDGTVVVLRACNTSAPTTSAADAADAGSAGGEWVEEKQLRASRLPLQWVRTRDPALVVGVGEKSCMLYYKNKNWL